MISQTTSVRDKEQRRATCPQTGYFIKPWESLGKWCQFGGKSDNFYLSRALIQLSMDKSKRI